MFEACSKKEGNKYNNVPLFFWFDHCLEARAEIRDLFIRIEGKKNIYTFSDLELSFIFAVERSLQLRHV